MRRKIPKTVVLLIVINIWLLLQELGTLLGYRESIDFRLLTHLDLGYLFFLVYPVIMFLTVMMLWFLYRPSPLGFQAVLASLAGTTIYGFLTCFVSMDNLDIVRGAFIARYEMRGIALNQSTLQLLASEDTMYGLIYFFMVGLIFFFIFMALLIFWNKPYFDPVPAPANKGERGILP